MNHSTDRSPGGFVPMRILAFYIVTFSVALPWARAQQNTPAADGAFGPINLPSSKQLGVVPGDPQRLNSLPMSLAVSPDGRYVVSVNAGYGTFESMYEQSLAVMDTRTGKVTDFPDDRTTTRDKQSLYSGLAFSGDGKHLYASMASLTAPVAGQAPASRWQGAGDAQAAPRPNTSNGVAVYKIGRAHV